MTTIDALQAEVSQIRLRLAEVEDLEEAELETLLVRLEVLRLQTETVHKEGEVVLTLAREDLEDLQTEAAIRRLSE